MTIIIVYNISAQDRTIRVIKAPLTVPLYTCIYIILLRQNYRYNGTVRGALTIIQYIAMATAFSTQKNGVKKVVAMVTYYMSYYVDR